MDWINPWLAGLTARQFAAKVRDRLVPGLRYLVHSRIRRCRVCNKQSVFLAFGPGDEFKLCVRCRSNLRYELIAQYLRDVYPDLRSRAVLELDPHSPLQPMLRQARSYVGSFYRAEAERGSHRADGAVCEDVTRLTFGDASLDLIVSSDVLEHVPDIESAFRESARVLKPGGAHVFTVPPRPATRCRARLVPQGVEHILPPEYHSDPLDPAGILTFWDFGPDLSGRLDVAGLEVRIVAGPEGSDGRVLWAAIKVPDAPSGTGSELLTSVSL